MLIPTLDQPGVLLLCCLHHVLPVGLGKAWRPPPPHTHTHTSLSSPKLLELVIRTYQPLTKSSLPAEAVTRVWLRKGLGAISESQVSDENPCSCPSRGMLSPEIIPQEMETSKGLACHTPRQPQVSHPSGHLAGGGG